MTPQDLIAAVYTLCQSGRQREANAQALDYFDDRMIAGRFPECDSTLSLLLPARLAPSTIISLLSITYHARRVLPARAKFYRAAFDEVARAEGKAYAKELLEQYH